MTRQPANAGRPQAGLQLLTERHLAAGGDAVARHPDGRVVCVCGAAPAERVEVRVTTDNKSFLRSEVVKILAPGPTRVEPPCAHFAQCGGCSLQHVAYPEQVASKDAALREALGRIGGLDLSGTEIEAPPTGTAPARAWCAPPTGASAFARGARRRWWTCSGARSSRPSCKRS